VRLLNAVAFLVISSEMVANAPTTHTDTTDPRQTRAFAGPALHHLDGLRDHLSGYSGLGARFAKWRAVIHITDALPSPACVNANAHELSRYAALCQEQGPVLIVELEVLMDGSHTIERCEQVTGGVLHAVFDALLAQGVALEGLLLKANMVIGGKECARQASVREVATATLRCLRRNVPAALLGIVFLSGDQTVRLATAHLNAINPGFPG
jgi:fructose-bisphosphate aldolase, class I